MTTLLTGAYGRVGTAIIDHLRTNFNFRYYDQFNHPSYPTEVGDIADYPSLADACDGVNDIIHLAAASRVDTSWPTVLQSNIVGSYNCFESARKKEIQSVVLASTNHVVGMYEEDHAPELYDPEYGLLIDHTTPVRPDSHYGTSKVFSEALGRYYVENYEYPKRVYVLRLGSIREPKKDHPYADAEEGVRTGKWDRNSCQYECEVRRMKGTWQSRRDVASLVQSCLLDDKVTYDIFYGVSDNPNSWFDINRAKERLGYEPQDSGADWDEPPADGFLSVDEDSAWTGVGKSIGDS